MQPYGKLEDGSNDIDKELNLDGVDDTGENDNLFDEDIHVEKDSPKEKEEIVQRFLFFDFETTQEKVVKETKLGQELEHVPNVCVAMTTCDDCRHRDFDADCGRCGKHEYIFTGEKCRDDFCKFLFSKNMKNTTAIAHNARGFDAQFILQYLCTEGIRPNKILTNGKTFQSIILSNYIFCIYLDIITGMKIMSLSVGSIKIIDSYNYLPMPLSSLPKTFGFE